MIDYTLKDFEQDLAALLRKAENAGIGIEDFCGCAEYIIQTGWTDIPLRASKANEFLNDDELMAMAQRIVKNANG